MVIAVVVLLVFVVIMGAGIIAQRRALIAERRAAPKPAGPRNHRTGDVMLQCGPDLVARQVSPISLFLLGYQPEALAGTALPSLVHPEDAAVLAEFARLRGTSGPPVVAVRLHHRDGTWRWFQARARRSPGEPDVIDLVAQDVSDRMRAANWLADQRSLADAVLSMASDAVVSLDADARVTAFNRAAESLFGWTREEAIGRDAAEILVPEHLRESYREMMRGLWERGSSGRVDEPTEAVVMRRDGQQIPVEATAWIVEAGNRRQLSTLIRDVSARKEAQWAMAQAREQALEASRLKSEFLATTSHEIRTPMNGVIGLTGLLLETDLDATQHRYADGIRAAGEALLTVINDILDYSKLESGRIVVEETDFDLRELVEEVVAVVAEGGRAKGVEVVGYCRPGLPVALRGDPGRLRQVLLNLAANAVKFTDRGEVVVRASWGTDAIEDADHVTVRFEVADTGIGIARENQERLFEAFVQADASSARRFGGTGLGLAISRRLVEAMGGRLGVDSGLGRGSTFFFELTLNRQGRGAPPARSPRPDLMGLRVLVIDAGVANRVVLEGQLRAWRMLPSSVASGAAAMAELRAATARYRPYDVVILDTAGCGADGVDLARQITADPAIALVHLVLVTADRPPDAAALRAAGVVSTVARPVSQAALFESLARALVPTAAETPGEAPGQTSGEASDQTGGEASDQTGVDRQMIIRAGASTRDSSPATPRGTILLAEDNDINQQVATAILTRLGYRADVVDNGSAALELAGRNDYDAVLMDVQMPGMDGFAATTELRHRERGRRHTPVIAMTAGASPDDRDRCRAAGMDDYLAKPIMPGVLQAMLDRWIAPAAPGQR